MFMADRQAGRQAGRKVFSAFLLRGGEKGAGSYCCVSLHLSGVMDHKAPDIKDNRLCSEAGGLTSSRETTECDSLCLDCRVEMCKLTGASV